MTKKMTLVVLFLAKLRSGMKLLTMLLMFGTILGFVAPAMTDAGIVSAGDLQQKRITGRVTDNSGSALPGVNIAEKGTTNGAITDASGNFTMNVTSANSVLSVSFIGYSTQEVVIGTQTSVEIVLKESLSALDEIVVVGYSTQQRKSLTGAVSTVNAASLSESSSTSAVQRLQGKAAGVTILNNHTPGEDATIRIRGMSTINDANPLWVVDGVPGATASPNDIESISILKDAASTSIYGARAANGVVLVTTKSGKKNQKLQMDVNVRQGITKNSNHYDLLNTQEYGEMLWLEAKNDGKAINVPVGTPNRFAHSQYGSGATPVIPDYIAPAMTMEGAASVNPDLYDYKLAAEDGDDTYLIMRANKDGTDWTREAERNAAFKEYTVDVTGGTSNTNYAFLLGYTKEEGVFKYTGFDRFNFRSNVTTSPAKWIEIGEKIGITYTNDYGYQTDNGESSIVSWAYRTPPIVPVLDIMGNYAGTRTDGVGNGQNPIFLLDKNQNDATKRMTLSGNAFVKFNILKGLSAQSLVGVNHYGQYSKNINFVEVATKERGTYDYLSESAAFSLQYTWTNTIEYSKVFGNHNFKAIVGSEAVNNIYNTFAAERQEYSFKDVNYMTLNTGLRGIANSGSQSEWSLYSLFGRFNYTLSDKYMVEGVVRRDGSSRFGAEKYGVFPAVSLGWRISEEDFMSATTTWIDELKIRGGYGVVGNDRMGNYNSYTQFALSFNDSFYPMGGGNGATGNTGFYQSTFGNNTVKWETTSTLNFGIDATLLKSVTLMVDVWSRTTSDMLYPKQLPLVYGTASTPSINIGEMNNKGFDIELGYSNTAMNGDLSFYGNLVFSRYKNELTKLTDNAGDYYQGSAYREQYYTRTQTGRAFPEYYGYVVEGIFNTDQEILDWPTNANNKLGYFKYKDVNLDGVINASDRTYIGSPHPDFTAGLSFGATYKGISIQAQLFASVGNDVINYVSRFIDYIQFESGKSHERLYQSWGSPYLNGDNTKATLPISLANDTPHQAASSAFIEDGSYLRMKNLRIGYDLNTLLKDRVRSLNIYFQASNLFTVTKYTGLDPEIGTGGINMGIDSGAWPTPKQFMFGITFGI
jgi:TonB-linked SusC/RagA family outer membrane protein